MQSSRRSFLQTTTAGAAAVLGLDAFGFLRGLAPVSAAEAKLDPKLVRLDDSIEPLVRVLEETPREKLLEEVAARIKKGTTYREILAALLLAGVRNVQPRPAVGFKFHAVLVVNSAHLASLASADGDRWLPIFWALDQFKSSQAQTQKESGWRMGPVDEPKVPSASKARQAFTDAMERWDEAGADAAVASMARNLSRGEVFELFAHYAARDFRDIGHKTIFVANSFRTLESIGWHHAEAVLRSLAYAMLQYDGENPAKSDHDEDRPWRKNEPRVAKIRENWTEAKTDPTATTDLLATYRTGSPDDASGAIVETLNKGVSPQSVWDATLCAAAEMMMRKPGIVALHSVTMSNAMRYCFEASASDETRRRILLQNAAFLPKFRASLGGKLPELKIEEVQGIAPKARDEQAVGEIFAEVDRDRMSAAKRTLAYLQSGRPVEELMHAARGLVFVKGNNAHDYKFSSAVLEDYYHLSPQWRDRYLASSMFYFRGTGAKDNDLVKRTRAALAQ
jgi:hypothetical protein